MKRKTFDSLTANKCPEDKNFSNNESKRNDIPEIKASLKRIPTSKREFILEGRQIS